MDLLGSRARLRVSSIVPTSSEFSLERVPQNVEIRGIFHLLADFPDWARNMITINHLLVIVNSSFNFLIYCGDVVFR